MPKKLFLTVIFFLIFLTSSVRIHTQKLHAAIMYIIFNMQFRKFWSFQTSINLTVKSCFRKKTRILFLPFLENWLAEMSENVFSNFFSRFSSIKILMYWIFLPLVSYTNDIFGFVNQKRCQSEIDILYNNYWNFPKFRLYSTKQLQIYFIKISIEVLHMFKFLKKMLGSVLSLKKKPDRPKKSVLLILHCKTGACKIAYKRR